MDSLIDRDTIVDMSVMNVEIGTRFDSAAGTIGATLLGDYAEFGVFQGRTFCHAYHRAAPRLPWMRFFAFDSFDGLPEPNGVDAGGEFARGQFACTEEQFVRRLQSAQLDMSRVHIIKGWFDQTLTSALRREKKMECVAIAYIDCDLYESAVPVFSFLTPLVRQGSILLVDDWYCFRSDPARGIQRAANEWLVANPDISLTPWYDFSHHGKAFLVTRPSAPVERSEG